MVQSSHYKNSEGIIVAFGNEGTYTFILEPESIVRYNLQFNLRKDTELEFHTMILKINIVNIFFLMYQTVGEPKTRKLMMNG